MKQNLLKTLLVTLMCVMGMGSAWADDVTFAFKTDADITYTETGTSGGGTACTVSKSNVTLSGTNAYTDSGKTLSVYKNSKLTITAPGKITQIDLSYNGKVYPLDEAPGTDDKDKGKFTASGAHAASYIPTTPATSITLNNSNSGKSELISLKVTYTAGTVVNVSGVSLNKNSATLTLGQSTDLVATVSPDNATNKLVSWTSADKNVAIVKDGKVTGIGVGQTTITVTTANGNKTATCTITVNKKAAPEGAKFFESFDGCIGAGGNDNVWSNINTVTELGNLDNSGWTTEGSATSGFLCALLRKVDSSTPSGLTTPALGIDNNAKLVFNAESWGTEGSNFFVDIVGDGSFTTSEDLPGSNISNAEKTAKITTLQKAGTWKTFTLNIEGLTAKSKLRFYAPANKRAFLDEVTVYEVEAPTSYEITVGDAGYATYVTHAPLDFSGSNVTAYVVSKYDNPDAVTNPKISLTEVTKVPAKKAVIVKAEPGTYSVNTADSADDVTSLLKYSVADKKPETYYASGSNVSSVYYVLAKEGDNVVFAPVSSGTIAAGKAYLVVSSTLGNAKPLTISFDDATSISKIAKEANNGAVYNVAGQRVASDYKGIIIKNGKKYINK